MIMNPELRKLKKLHHFYGGFDYTGLSAKVLAEELGVNKSTISRWFSGHTRPSKRYLRRIKEVLSRYNKNTRFCPKTAS